MPADALATLAAQLREDDSVVSPYVRDPEATPVLGELVAAGPGAAGDPAGYAVVVEAVREGYLLHYGTPRLLAGLDADLRLLAGDYLYALGLERLASLGDLAAVRALSDLISLSAQLHAGGPSAAADDATATGSEPAPGETAATSGGGEAAAADALWLAVITAIAAASYEPLEPAKAALRAGDSAAARVLTAATDAAADAAGLTGRLARLRAGIDFRTLPSD